MNFSDGHLKCCRLQTMSDVVQWPMGHVQVSRCGCLGSSFRPPAGRPRLHAAADADVNISSSSSSPPFPPCSSPSSNQQTVPGAVLRTGCASPRPSRPFLSLLWPSPYSDWQDVIHLGRLFTRNEDGEADQTPGQDTIRHGSRDPGRGRLESGDEMDNGTVYTRRDGQRDRRPISGRRLPLSIPAFDSRKHQQEPPESTSWYPPHGSQRRPLGLPV